MIIITCETDEQAAKAQEQCEHYALHDCDYSGMEWQIVRGDSIGIEHAPGHSQPEQAALGCLFAAIFSDVPDWAHEA